MKSSVLFDFNEVFTGVPQEKGEHYGSDPKIQEYQTIPNFDREPVTLIQPDMKTGPWIAGGAALHWWQNQTVGDSDIDVFCRDEQQVNEVLDRIKAYGRWTEKYNSDNAVTIEYWQKENYGHRWIIQVIKRRYFKSLQDVIRSFDLTVCEIGTCGYEWELGPFTAKDIREKVLRFKMPLQSDAVKRLTKYWIYGYRPVAGTIDAVINNPSTKWNFNVDEDYQNAF